MGLDQIQQAKQVTFLALFCVSSSYMNFTATCSNGDISYLVNNSTKLM